MAPLYRKFFSFKLNGIKNYGLKNKAFSYKLTLKSYRVLPIDLESWKLGLIAHVKKNIQKSLIYYFMLIYYLTSSSDHLSVKIFFFFKEQLKVSSWNEHKIRVSFKLLWSSDKLKNPALTNLLVNVFNFKKSLLNFSSMIVCDQGYLHPNSLIWKIAAVLRVASVRLGTY